MAELGDRQRNEEINSDVRKHIATAIEEEKNAFFRKIKYFAFGFTIFSTMIATLVATFPDYVISQILKIGSVRKAICYSIKEEFLTVKEEKIKDYTKQIFEKPTIRKAIYASIKAEFRDSGDNELRNYIINDQIKKELSLYLIQNKLSTIGIEQLQTVNAQLPNKTWDSLINHKNKRKKISEFLDDEVFFNELKNVYYDEMISVYESATRVDQDEHIKILKERTSEGVAVDIEGLGLEFDNQESSCRSSVVDHLKKQLVIVLPDFAPTLSRYPDIKDRERLEYPYFRCDSSVFPRLSLSIKVRGKRIKNIELIGVERPAGRVGRAPLLRVTQAISKELALPYTEPKNLISATGKVYIEKASYD